MNGSGAQELQAKIAKIAAESKARSQAGEAILGNTFGNSKACKRPRRTAQVPGRQPQEDPGWEKDLQRGLELADEAAEQASDDGYGSGGATPTGSNHGSAASASSTSRQSEDGDSEDVDLSDDSMPSLDTLEMAQILEQLILTAGFAQSHKQAMEQLLLKVRNAQFWIQVVKQVKRPARRELVKGRGAVGFAPATSTMLRVLHGRLTLYEALTALGPTWSVAAGWLKCAAQRRLNEFCSAKSQECHFASAALLLRSGASLLSTDGRGRLPAHLAANTGTPTSLQLLVRLLQLAPATLLMEDDEGATVLDLLARAPLMQAAGERSDEVLVLTQSTSTAPSPLLTQLSDAALTCAAALPQQTTRLLQQSPEAARAWRTLASAGGGRAALLLAPDQMDQSLEDLTYQAEEREGQAAARLRQGLQRINVLQSLAESSEDQMQALEPQELRLRLARLEQVHQQHRDEAAATQASLEAENRQLKRSLAEKEDEMVMLSSKLEQQRASVESLESGGSEAGNGSLGNLNQELTPTTWGSMERAVVEDIRKARLVGVEAESLPEDIRRGVLEMRRSLTAAVDRLARDLYESQAHFLQELLQNADDNNYEADILPRMDLVLRSRPANGGSPYFFAANNEVGLSEVDVRALCDISRSSKTQAGSTTGYKGVGWKSVFRVSDAPHVLSRNWRFKFSSTELGMLTPIWLEEKDIQILPQEVLDAHQKGETVFYLPLADPGISVPSIRAEMQTIEADCAQLLFLRRVMQISLRGDWTAAEETANSQPAADGQYVVLSATLSPNGVRTATCCQQCQGSEVFTQKITSFEVNRHEDVAVALPLLDAASEAPSQRVFAFLPVRSVGFRFAVQAPFHLTASRADLHRSPENLRRRNAVAPAFIKACQESFEVASRALEYLGTEPAEPFWMPVRQQILQELRNLACVATESGQAVPDQCLLRGNMPAAQWITNDLLQEASGFSFVEKSASIDTLHELGVREFSHEELVACIQYRNGCWLQSLWREQNRRSAAFNDLYKSLLDSILEDPARLSEVQNLLIFPVAATHASKTLRGALFNEVDLCSSVGLHTAPCGSVPQSMQTHLVRCLEPSLEMSSQSLRLLQLLGVEPVSESELEAAAFRTLLQIRIDPPSKASGIKKRPEVDGKFDHKSYWSAMTVLKRSYLKGRRPLPPHGWEALKGAVNLLSHSQQLVPATQLRLWSFLGVELRLPPALISNICSIAGIESLEEAPSRNDYVERAASPPISGEPDVPALESNLGWEVFMCNVFNCQPADPLTTSPGGPPLPEGFLEAFLRLGEILTTGQFWQKAAGSQMTLEYLSRVMHLNRRSEIAFARRNFLRKLSARSQVAPRGTLQDLFLQEVFQSLAGCYLPYISGVPSHPQVHALLQWCGVSTEIDEFSLVKALRFARESEIQDLGLVSEIYRRLHQCGYSPGEEKIFLIPGKGYMSKSECVWRPFKCELLRRCCLLEVLQDHYSRFGPEVRTALCTWIRESPETSAKALCEALLMAIECARVDTSRSRHIPGKPSIPPVEAASKLFPAAKAAVEELVKLCVGTYVGRDLIPPEPSQRVEDKRPDGVVFNHFVQQRMIVIPGIGDDDVQCRILSMGEAYWDVTDELLGTPAEEIALNTHYGVGGNQEATAIFFTDVLHVKPLLTLDDWTSICQATVTNQLFPSVGSKTIEEGLKLFQLPSGGGGGFFDLDRAVDALYDRLRNLPPPSEGPELSPPREAAAPGRRTWHLDRYLGGGIPLFCANGATPPPEHMSQEEVMLLLNLCRHFGVHPRQIGFGYDPSGASVCRERLFLDLKYLQRARLLQNQAGYPAVVSFWAGKMARMLGNLGQVPAATAAAFRDRLLEEVLPGLLEDDGGDFQ